ncbi:Gamma-1-syntrophin [Nibea albiflora]|uniref:Gamma-1-syntrophin n=1 Tax=Nibea albiflora TaxID=240163 RepID=A0ACB7FIW3_NIBAL|nr:Gamma-1-syntrophin [Nibea albiflora]
MHCAAAAADCCVTNLRGLDYPVWVAYLNWRMLPPNTSTANDDDNDLTDGLASTKTGIYLMQEGNEEPFNIRLHLAKDILTIQEQDVICVSGEPFYSSERTVTIRRQTIGGFGLSIKGGAEHKIPVVISKISKEQKAELSGLLFIGDGILQINGINVRSYRHEEVVQVLRNAGEEVTLTVSFLKKTPAFLKLPLCEDCTCIPSDQSSGTSSPLCDSGLHLNYHPNNTVKKINRNFPVNQQIIYMGWVDEKEQDSVQDRMYSPKFLALRGSSLFKFSAPPVTTWDWTRAEKSFTVYEIMCKILKDNDLLDKRKHCFSVQTESGEDMFFSVELDCELLIWEKAFQMATFLEVERIQCKTYACIMESHLMGLTVDFSMGFVCFDAASKAVLWRYKFSQLKGSSDDGKSKIKFLFQNQDSKSIEAKELEFSNLFAVLHCIHAFFAAKVACLDPMFVESQGNATTTGFPSLSSISCNSQTPKLKYAT